MKVKPIGDFIRPIDLSGGAEVYHTINARKEVIGFCSGYTCTELAYQRANPLVDRPTDTMMIRWLGGREKAIGECAFCGKGRAQAIVSSTVMPKDGIYKVETLEFSETARWDRHSLAGIRSYVRHISTRKILEDLGAHKSPSNMYSGQAVGDIIIAVTLIKSRHPRRYLGKTAEVQASMDDLRWRRVTKLHELTEG